MTTFSILWAAYSGGVVFTGLLFILHHSSGHSTCACTTPRAGDFIFSLFFSQLPWVVISALDDDVFLLFLSQIMLLDFQQWLMSSSSQTTGEAFPGRSQHWVGFVEETSARRYTPSYICSPWGFTLSW